MDGSFLAARQAARYVGYEVGDRPVREERGLRTFYEAARQKRVPKYGDPGRILFKRKDLDRAWGTRVDGHEDDDRVARLEEMEDLARAHAAGGDRRAN